MELGVFSKLLLRGWPSSPSQRCLPPLWKALRDLNVSEWGLRWMPWFIWNLGHPSRPTQWGYQQWAPGDTLPREPVHSRCFQWLMWISLRHNQQCLCSLAELTWWCRAVLAWHWAKLSAVAVLWQCGPVLSMLYTTLEHLLHPCDGKVFCQPADTDIGAGKQKLYLSCLQTDSKHGTNTRSENRQT